MTDLLLAEILMGDNYLDLDIASKLYHRPVLIRHERYMQSVPYSEKTLKDHKDTHLLVACPPISLRHLEICLLDHVRFKGSQGVWFSCCLFYVAEMTLDWILIPKKVSQLLRNSNFNEQLAWFEQNSKYHMASAAELIYSYVTHYMQTGLCLFEKGVYVTSSRLTEGEYVTVEFKDDEYIELLVLNDIANTHLTVAILNPEE